MEQLHPVLPTLEQLTQWEDDWHNEREHADILLIQAFQAGADAELKASTEWIKNHYIVDPEFSKQLLAARRPKPPSLKDEALAALKRQRTRSVPSLAATNDCETILRAIEALPD